jgi:hypothetical protein
MYVILMSFSRTSFFGYCAAVLIAADSVPELPPAVRPWVRVAAAVCVALVGYHASDNTGPKGGTRPGPLLPLLIGSMVLGAGCQVAEMGVQVQSPTFGSLGVTIGGGTLGRPHAVPAGRLTTAPPTAETLVPSQPATNSAVSSARSDGSP